ncbi:aryl hydrocarbon receptor-like [Brachionichthys hirsutus]|uniref:aryl hydrocarbon receptor-like n=1 Tax=Brachionichthys hirsutus TaxID=412623 RepID=UPI0036050DF8
MLANTALYAAKKRKKPVQKIPKPAPPDGIKSNPSKRHRDRLNGELDKLTSLLPFAEEVRSRLDKLSVLRLSVGYLKVKSFFNASMKKGLKGSSWTMGHGLGGNVKNAAAPAPTASPSSQVASIDGVSFSEGELLLQALNGFVLAVTAEGYVFYTSPTILDFLGFHQSDIVHQSVFELIHTDDRALFRRQLHFALDPNRGQPDGTAEDSSEQSSAEISSNVMTYDPQTIPPENSSFLERNFCCRFRCLLDNSSGFLALNFHGRLKLVHGQNRLFEDGKLVPPQLALFAIATPMQPPSILEIRSKMLIFQTKHKLDFSPLGIDTRGKVVLGYSEVEIALKGSGYNFIHAADMMYCADNHMRMIKTGESGFTVFRLLSKGGAWIWVQANARVVFKGGKPDFIVARQKALSNDEGEEQSRLRRLQLPFHFATGEALLYDVAPTLTASDPCSASKQRKLDGQSVSSNSLLGCYLNQNQSAYCEHNTINSLNDIAFQDTHPTVSVPRDVWTDPAAKAGGSAAKPDDVQEMMDTLQQILGDNDLSDALDVAPEELKSWESTLLKMSTHEMNEDLNDILNDDILTYVEEQLQAEGGFQIPDQLVDLSPCLSTLDAQSGDPGRPGEQNFPWHLDLQDNAGQQRPVQGTMRLTHMYASVQPTLQPQTLPAAGGLRFGTGAGMDASVPFDPSLVNSCFRTQNQRRTLQGTAEETAFSLGQTATGQIQTHQMAQPVENHLQASMPGLPVGLQNRQPVENHLQVQSSHHMLDFQGDRWNSNRADSFIQTYNPNISKETGFTAEPLSSSVLQTEPRQNQRRPQMQQMAAFHSGPLPGVVTAQNSPNPSSLPFPVQQPVAPPPLAPSSSCRFANVPQALSVNGVHLGRTPPLQRLHPTSRQIPSCFYQSSPGAASASVPPPGETTPSCQMTPGLGSKEVQQQPYLHSQVIKNVSQSINGGVPFSSLSNGSAYYSEDN